MARNGSGTMAIVNSFTPSTTISSSAVNANFSDIGDEITNSVAVDGQSTMTGVLKLANGSASAPSMTFGSDTNTGVYRKGADSLGFGTAGSERAYIDSSGKLFALGAFDVAGAVNLQGALAVGSTLELGHASDTTLARDSAGVVSIEGNVILTDNDLGSSVQAFDADILKADTADTLTAGFDGAENDLGTITTGTVTPDQANGNFQHYVNNGAHTLAPPSTSNGVAIIVQVTNAASAGAVTTSGFTKVTGSFTTTNGDDFMLTITKCNGFSHLNIVKLQ